MNKLIDHEKFVVYDGVLPEEDMESFYLWGQNLRYSSINSGGESMKIWRVSDGNPLVSVESYDHSDHPFGNKIDILAPKVIEISKNHPEVFGEYDSVFFRSYVYGKGTKIDWHTDHGYKSAAIFYYHPYWGSNWGGELKVAEIPEIEYGVHNVGGPMDNRWIDRILSVAGFGYYFEPKPNRLVATRAGVWHSINRVDENAGDNLRFSIVAFFN